MPRPALHVPESVGYDALKDLGRVPWNDLDHAYGTGRVGDKLHEDVKATLAHLPDTPHESLYALSCNVVHQGTIYESTAYAVPFMAAVAAGSVPAFVKRELVVLLGHIAIASTFEAIDGGHSGSYGEDVGEATRRALAASEKHLHAIGMELTNAVLAVARQESPTGDRIDRIAEQLGTLEGADPEDEAPAPKEVPERWYAHKKFGVGKLVSEEPGGLRLRFEDGSERLILAEFLKEADPP